MTKKQIKYQGKPASLIVQSSDKTKFICESMQTENLPKGILAILRGIYATIDPIKKNMNGRTYDFNNYFSQVQTLMPKIEAKRLFGELEHVKRRTIKYPNVSHRIESITWNPTTKSFEGEIALLDTPAGRIAYAIASAGSPLYISSRAIGIVDSKTGKVNLLKLITYDLVAEPGFYDAAFNIAIDNRQASIMPMAVNESRSMLYVNEAFDEDEDYDEALLMQQLTSLATSGKLQSLFPNMQITGKLQRQLVCESLENIYINESMKRKQIDESGQNQVNFVNAYSNLIIGENIKLAEIQKIEAIILAVAPDCDFSDVSLAAAFNAATVEQQATLCKLIGVDFVNESLNIEYLDSCWKSMTTDERVEFLKEHKIGNADKVSKVTNFEDLDNQDEIVEALIKDGKAQKDMTTVDEAVMVGDVLPIKGAIKSIDGTMLPEGDYITVSSIVNDWVNGTSELTGRFVSVYKRDFVNEAMLDSQTRDKLIPLAGHIWDDMSVRTRRNMLANNYDADDINAIVNLKFSAIDAANVEDIKQRDIVKVLVDNGELDAKNIVNENYIKESSTPQTPANWWFNAKEADRQQILVTARNASGINVSDAADATWEMFNEQSRNAIAAAMRAQGFVMEARATQFVDRAPYDISGTNIRRGDAVSVSEITVGNVAPFSHKRIRIVSGDEQTEMLIDAQDKDWTGNSVNEDVNISTLASWWDVSTKESRTQTLKDAGVVAMSELTKMWIDLSPMTRKSIINSVAKVTNVVNESLEAGKQYVATSSIEIISEMGMPIATLQKGDKFTVISTDDTFPKGYPINIAFGNIRGNIKGDYAKFVNESFAAKDVALKFNSMNIGQREMLMEMHPPLENIKLAYEKQSEADQILILNAFFEMLNENEDEDIVSVWSMGDETTRIAALNAIGEKDMTYAKITDFDKLPQAVQNKIRSGIENIDTGLGDLIKKAADKLKSLPGTIKKKLDDFASESLKRIVYGKFMNEAENTADPYYPTDQIWDDAERQERIDYIADTSLRDKSILKKSWDQLTEDEKKAIHAAMDESNFPDEMTSLEIFWNASTHGEKRKLRDSVIRSLPANIFARVESADWDEITEGDKNQILQAVKQNGAIALVDVNESRRSIGGRFAKFVNEEESNTTVPKYLQYLQNLLWDEWIYQGMMKDVPASFEKQAKAKFEESVKKYGKTNIKAIVKENVPSHFDNNMIDKLTDSLTFILQVVNEDTDNIDKAIISAINQLDAVVDMKATTLVGNILVAKTGDSLEEKLQGITPAERQQLCDILNIVYANEANVEVTEWWGRAEDTERYQVLLNINMQPTMANLYKTADWADLNKLIAGSQFNIQSIIDNIAPMVNEAAVYIGDIIEIWDLQGNSHQATVNAVDDNTGYLRLTVTYGNSTSGIVSLQDGKWVLTPAQRPGLVNENIQQGNWDLLSNADRTKIINHINKIHNVNMPKEFANKTFVQLMGFQALVQRYLTSGEWVNEGIADINNEISRSAAKVWDTLSMSDRIAIVKDSGIAMPGFETAIAKLSYPTTATEMFDDSKHMVGIKWNDIVRSMNRLGKFNQKFVNEGIQSDKVFNAMSEGAKNVIRDYFKPDAFIRLLSEETDATIASGELVAKIMKTIYASMPANIAKIADANTDSILLYIAAFLQDRMVSESRIVFLPKSRRAKFINEAEEQGIDPETVDNIIDGLVDDRVLTAPQADEVKDAVSDAPELTDATTKTDIANLVADTASGLGYDVDVDDCIAQVNEGNDAPEIVRATLKGKSYDDFELRAISVDDRTKSVVMTKDGQLTGIELDGDMTESNSKELQAILRAALASVNMDESLKHISHKVKAISIDESKLSKLYDIRGNLVFANESKAQPLYLEKMPPAYKIIMESLTDCQLDLVKRQAESRTFINEADVASFYRTRNWNQIKTYSGNAGSFINEGQSVATTRSEFEQNLIDSIRS